MSTFAVSRELLVMAWRMDRAKLIKSILLMFGGFVATPLIAVGLRVLTDDLLAGRHQQAAAVGFVVAALLMLELMGMHFAHLSYFELGEMAQAHVQHRLFSGANASISLARREQPAYADELQVTQSQAWRMNNSLEAILQFGGLVVQLVLSTVLLAALDPLLAFIPFLAVFLVLASHRAQREVNRSQEAAAGDARRERHLLRLATTPESLIELRLLGLQQEIIDRHGAAWDAATRHLWRGQARSAVIRSVGQIAFAAGYAGALLLVFRQVASGRATVGDFVMVLALAVQTTAQITSAVSLLAMLQQAGVTIGRINRLSEPDDDPVAAPALTDGNVIPSQGIELRNVSFAYPGSTRPVIDHADLSLPAGAIVAVVGENGAGKSTLIKLLCGLYRPSAGQIFIGGREVVGEASGGDRVAALFQDFAHIELAMRDSVGVGACDGAEIAPDDDVREALDRAGATALVDQQPDGLAAILGTTYSRGAELSGGQWQRIGLSRALVKHDPAMLTLDEPAAALDTMAEHALFERFAAAARHQDARGAVTVYVSHRFSTVRMADVIVVLEGGRVAACGTHDELMGAGGTYAQLYTMQARAYASASNRPDEA